LLARQVQAVAAGLVVQQRHHQRRYLPCFQLFSALPVATVQQVETKQLVVVVVQQP
jgi:hypothetical protein